MEVAYFDESEAKMEKTPQTFNNFIYDNQTDGGCLNKLDETAKKINAVRGNIDALHARYRELMAIYDKFTRYDETMEKIIRTMTTQIEAAEKHFNNIVSTAQQAINEHMTTDTTLMSDLEQLNSLLSAGSAE